LLTPPYWRPASQLCDLTVLNVSLNGLEDIPAELGSMSKLESLNMNDNRMKTVPDVVRFAATLCSPR
jgi:Leucine-rich repeat (LRR) protein